MTDRASLDVTRIHDIHDQIVRQYDLDHAGVGRPNSDLVLGRIVEDARRIESPYDRAAFYLKRLIEAHVFEDGNKRTAWLAAVWVLQHEGLRAAVDRREVATVLKHVRRFDHADLSTWLETGAIDRSRFRSR